MWSYDQFRGAAIKIHHDTVRDYLTIDFAQEVEARSVYSEGMIVRYDKAGHVIGIDITDSMKLFGGSDFMTLQEVCRFLGVSESTVRRKVRANRIKHTMEGNRYQFRKSDVLGLAPSNPRVVPP